MTFDVRSACPPTDNFERPALLLDAGVRVRLASFDARQA
jgi:hypothetical protein